MNKTKTNHTPQQGLIISKHGYEQSVIARAMGRAGHNPHLKGHIHEVLVKDARNARNFLTMNGASTELTKSTTAGTVDLVTTKGGKVIERLQVKDVTSQAGIEKLVRQCADGKYRSAQLVGSEESAQLFNKAAESAGISKRMTSTGVSSKSTESLARRAGATGSGSFSSATWQAAHSNGVTGATVGVGVEVISGIVDLVNGKRDAVEVTGAVVKAGAKGYVTSAAAGAAATAGGAAVTSGLAAVGAPGILAVLASFAAPAVIVIGVTCLASKFFDWIFD